MSMLSNILPPSGSNLYGGFPPQVYTSPYHLFNIDDDSSKMTTGAKMTFIPEDHFYPFVNCCFDYNPEASLNGEPSPLLSVAEQLFSSSPLLQSPLEESASAAEGEDIPQEEASIPSPFLHFGSQASTPHNRRMIFPYTYKQKGSPGNKSTSSSSTSPSSSPAEHDEPLLLYRFFEFYCTNCEQCWLSPLFRAKNGCYCRICHHFILPRGIRHSFTPYLGKETCYGKYSCHLCNRGWSSYKSLSNKADQCFQCGTMIYPYYQIAHSVLFHKIHKNDDELNAKSAFLKSFLSTKSSEPAEDNNNSAESGSLVGRQQQRPRRNSRLHNQHPRKITSISVLHPPSGVSSGKQSVTNKKRLPCLNNTPFLRHSAQQVRRQFHLKSCFSEPTIVNNTGGMEVAELGKFQRNEGH